jgi:type II secretory pathway pseudopilin PulG
MNRIKRKSAFSLLELIILVGIVAVIAVIFLPAMAPRHGHTHAPRIKCVNNLKNLGLAYRIYATDNNDRFPTFFLASNAVNLTSVKITEIYQSLSNELSTPKIIICPSDVKAVGVDSFAKLTPKNISYFASLTADESTPQIILGGDRNILVNKAPTTGLLALTTNTPASWSKDIHNEQGNLVMSDGSVQQMSNARLKIAISDQGIATNNLLFP